MASYSAFLGSAGFISMLSVSNPVLRLHLGCLRTCWIELSLQREHDFALLQELQFGHLFGHLLDPCPLPFRHRTHLRGSLRCSCGLPLRPLLPPLMLSGIRKGSLLALGSLFAPPWVPFTALGVLFRDRVLSICSLSTWFHCPFSGDYFWGLFLLAIWRSNSIMVWT